MASLEEQVRAALAQAPINGRILTGLLPPNEDDAPRVFAGRASRCDPADHRHGDPQPVTETEEAWLEREAHKARTWLASQFVTTCGSSAGGSYTCTLIEADGRRTFAVSTHSPAEALLLAVALRSGWSAPPDPLRLRLERRTLTPEQRASIAGWLNDSPAAPSPQTTTPTTKGPSL